MKILEKEHFKSERIFFGQKIEAIESRLKKFAFQKQNRMFCGEKKNYFFYFLFFLF
jgi:hypothetical protein